MKFSLLFAGDRFEGVKGRSWIHKIVPRYKYLEKILVKHFLWKFSSEKTTLAGLILTAWPSPAVPWAEAVQMSN